MKKQSLFVKYDDVYDFSIKLNAWSIADSPGHCFARPLFLRQAGNRELEKQKENIKFFTLFAQQRGSTNTA